MDTKLVQYLDLLKVSLRSVMTTQLISSRFVQDKDGELKAQRMAMTHMDTVTGDGDTDHPSNRKRMSKLNSTKWKPLGLRWREDEPREWLLLVLIWKLSRISPGVTLLSLLEKSGTHSKLTSMP